MDTFCKYVSKRVGKLLSLQIGKNIDKTEYIFKRIVQLYPCLSLVQEELISICCYLVLNLVKVESISC